MLVLRQGIRRPGADRGQQSPPAERLPRPPQPPPVRRSRLPGPDVLTASPSITRHTQGRSQGERTALPAEPIGSSPRPRNLIAAVRGANGTASEEREQLH